MKSKRGFFFTLSAIFIVSIIFLVYSAEKIRPDLEKRFALEKLQETSLSLESSIREILSHFSNFNVKIEKMPDGTVNVTFIDTISRNKDDWGSELNDIMQDFKTFVESEDKNVKINVTKMISDKELPLTIDPYNITYSRSWGIGHVILGVLPENNITFQTYEVKINSSSTQIDKVQSQLRRAGNLLFRVTAVDDYGTSLVHEKWVDPLDNHQVQVFFIGGNKARVDLINGELETWTNVDSSITVETKVGILPPNEQRASVKVFKDVININYPDFGVSKLGSVIVFEG